MNAPPEPGDVPPWLTDAIRDALDELRAFFLTAYEATVRPAHLAATWSIGKRRALNPIAFFATSLAITGTLQHLVSRARGGSDDASSLVSELAGNASPYVAYLSVGLLCHYLVWRRGPRPPLRGTLGIALYAGGGPAALVRFFDSVLSPLLPGRFTRLHAGVDLIGVVAFVLALSDALMGLHRVPRWRAVLAVVVTSVVVASAIATMVANVGPH